MVTPAAARGLPLPPVSQWFSLVDVDPHKADAIEYVRNAVAAHPLRANVSTISYEPALNDDQKTFEQIRNGLLIGSLFTLALAGISLLVLALEQVRERRRPLAMLSASGVPRGVLARSLLWQIAVPVVLGVVAAIATGIGLAALVLRLTSTVFQLDWADVGLFSGAAAVLVLLVTAATLPALRNATRLSALRTE
jgi:predicted lysophospholipase L1 biosynthesis ABC-type transport system permease subunit